MKSQFILTTFLGAAITLLSTQAGAAIRSVDQMTCAEAVAFATKHKRFYKLTLDGVVVPIYPVMPVHEGPVCKSKEVAWYFIEQTLDSDQCHLGYTCSPK